MSLHKVLELKKAKPDPFSQAGRAPVTLSLFLTGVLTRKPNNDIFGILFQLILAVMLEQKNNGQSKAAS